MYGENTEKLLQEFKSWASKQESSEYIISFSREKGDHIIVDTEYARGTTSFYLLENFVVVEMSVVNKHTSEAVFYLQLRHCRRPGDLACLPPGLSQRPVCRRLAQGDAYRLISKGDQP